MKTKNYFIILCILLLIILCTPIVKESFKDDLNIEFVSIPVGIQIFDRSMHYDKMYDIEIYSRTNGSIGLDLERGERISKLRALYHSKIMEFSQEEKDAISKLCSKIKLDNAKWKFIKIDNGIDWNYPYTIGDSIILPADKVYSMKNSVETTDKILMRSHINTLTHEYMHVLQRKYQHLFDKFYIEKWGFTKPKNIENDAWVKKYWITNPDTMDENWLYDLNQLSNKDNKKPNFIWTRFLVDPKDFKQHIKVAINVDEIGNGDYEVVTVGGIPLHKDLISVKSFNDRFFNIRQIYHPNEIFANFAADAHNLRFMYPNDYKEIHDFLNNILKLK